MQDWPAWLKPATLSFAAAPRQSPSGSMMTGLLLPSSRLTFLRAARSRIPQPTSGEPVNVIIATSRCITSGSPTAAPPPVTTLSHPGGRPHSSINSVARAMADSGVWLAGLSTTGQPAAIAGPTLWLTRVSGKLNGLMAPTTPTGAGGGHRPVDVAGVARGHPPELRPVVRRGHHQGVVGGDTLATDRHRGHPSHALPSRSGYRRDSFYP